MGEKRDGGMEKRGRKCNSEYEDRWHAMKEEGEWENERGEGKERSKMQQ